MEIARKQTVADIDLTARRVLVRVDLDVGQNAHGHITDDSRLAAALPTIRHLLERKARIVLMSHLGRPEGKPNPRLRMNAVAARLQELLQYPVTKLDGCIEADVVNRARQASERSVVVLENLRFYQQEEAGDAAFGSLLARHGEVYVADAFRVVHRPDASVCQVTRFVPAVAGLLLEKELSFLSRIAHEPEHPFVVVLGGEAVPDRLGVVKTLGPIADRIVIGGALAFAYLRARGLPGGRCAVEENLVSDAKQQIDVLGDKLVLPVDLVAASRAEAGARTRIAPVAALGPDDLGPDIGPASRAAFLEALVGARMVVWDGSMGASEIDEFAAGTEAIARTIAGLKATTVVGGDDAISALGKVGLADRVSHVSTGGEATLACLAGRDLPGIRTLKDKQATSP